MAALICGCMVAAGGVLGGVGFLLGGGRGFYVDGSGAHYYQDTSTTTINDGTYVFPPREQTAAHHGEGHHNEAYWEESADCGTLDALEALESLDEGTVQEQVQGERIKGDIQLIPFHSIRGTFYAEQITLVESDRYAVEYDLNSGCQIKTLEVANDTLSMEIAPASTLGTYLNFSLSRGAGVVRIHYPKGTQFNDINVEYTSGALIIADLEVGHLSATHASGACSLRNITGSVELSSASGSTEIADSHLQMIDIASASGNVQLSNLKVEDAVSVAVTSGDTVMTGVNAHALELSGTSGDFRLDGCTTESFSAELISGDVIGTGLETQDLYAFTTSGRLDLAGAFHNNSELCSTSGTILFHSTLPESSYSCSVKTVSGTIKSAQAVHNPDAPNHLEISTTSGNAEYSFG